MFFSRFSAARTGKPLQNKDQTETCVTWLGEWWQWGYQESLLLDQGNLLAQERTNSSGPGLAHSSFGHGVRSFRTEGDRPNRPSFQLMSVKNTWWSLKSRIQWCPFLVPNYSMPPIFLRTKAMLILSSRPVSSPFASSVHIGGLYLPWSRFDSSPGLWS